MCSLEDLLGARGMYGQASMGAGVAKARESLGKGVETVNRQRARVECRLNWSDRYCRQASMD